MPNIFVLATPLYVNSLISYLINNIRLIWRDVQTEPEFRFWTKPISYLRIFMKMLKLYTKCSSRQKNAQVNYTANSILFVALIIKEFKLESQFKTTVIIWAGSHPKVNLSSGWNTHKFAKSPSKSAVPLFIWVWSLPRRHSWAYSPEIDQNGAWSPQLARPTTSCPSHCTTLLATKPSASFSSRPSSRWLSATTRPRLCIWWTPAQVLNTL